MSFRKFGELLDEYLENPEFKKCFLIEALADDNQEAQELSLSDLTKLQKN